MSNKLTKRDVHFHPNWLAVLIALLAMCGSVCLVVWGFAAMPVEGAAKVALIILFILVAVVCVCFGTMRLILELYSKGVWATDEEQTMRFPGDDIFEGKGYGRPLRVRQARDLDAPVEAVWKHVKQMDPSKGGMYAWSNCERLFGMNVDNAYSLEDMWQGPEACKPGDFWAWSYAGFGGEVADIVENKYITWFADTNDTVRTPGASYMLFPGLKHCAWYWTIALKPLDGGKRCRIYSCYDIYYGPRNPINYALQKAIIYDGGAMMGRRAFRNLELSALVERRKSIPLRIQGALLGRSRGDDDRLHERIAYPNLRWAREFPRIETIRAPFTDDPNWPPAEGEEYVPPVAENNAKCGWSPETSRANDAKADDRQRELLRELGYEDDAIRVKGHVQPSSRLEDSEV